MDKLLALLGMATFLFLLVPLTAQTEPVDPCDITFSACSDSCVPQNWGKLLKVHSRGLECFKFYRRYCGFTQWTLIYEGPNNFFCDCGYNPGGSQQYRAERFQIISGQSCGPTVFDSCESIYRPHPCNP